MALAPFDLPFDASRPIPQRVRTFLDDAAARIDAFIEQYKDDPVAGFVPSDYEAVYRAFAALRQSPSAGGDEFCEWGSGIGVITCLAAMLGYDAVGIEIDKRLVAASRKFAAKYRLPVQFVCGSYVPNDYRPPEDDDPSHVMTMDQGRAAYDELGLDPDDFEVIFAYPWPGEDDVVTSLFDDCAARGAILITFHGQDGLMLRRKTR
jgi:hypothetical protein